MQNDLQDAFKWPALQKANGCLPFHTAQRLLEGLDQSLWKPSSRDLHRCGVFSSYEGPTDQGGRPHGAGGRASFASGDSYKGAFRHGFMHGRGEYLWADGIKYTGAVVEDELTGQGKIEWPSGDVYVGQVCRGFRHGVGTHTKVSPHARARTHARTHARGLARAHTLTNTHYRLPCPSSPAAAPPPFPTSRDASGVPRRRRAGAPQWRADCPEEVEGVYHGEWVCGRRHGHGRLTVGGDEAEWYEGGWHLGRRRGPGTMQYRSGNLYVGEWEDGPRPAPPPPLRRRVGGRSV